MAILTNVNRIMSNPDHEFKLLLIGDGGVGKETFVNRFLTATTTTSEDNGQKIHQLLFHTNRGSVKFNVWNSAGQQKNGGLPDGFYAGGHCAIMMYDVSNRITFKNVPNWHRDLTDVCGNIPIVLAANKVDVKGGLAKAKQITFPLKKKLPYFKMSATTNVNVVEPFLHLARKIVGDNKLHLTVLRPPEVLIADAADAAQPCHDDNDDDL